MAAWRDAAEAGGRNNGGGGRRQRRSGSARRRDASGRRRPLQASLCRGRRRLYGVNGGRGGVRAHGIGGGRETCGVRRVRPSDGAPQRACAANGPGVAQPNAASACGWLHGSGWLGTAREEQAGSGERPREGAGARGVVARTSRAEQGKGAGPVLCRVREGGRRREEGEGRRKERKGGKEKKRERKWEKEKEKEKGGEREGKKRGGERSAPGSRR